MGHRRVSEPNVEAFLALIEQRAPRPLAIDEMARMLTLDRFDRRRIRTALEAQVAQRKIRRIGKTRYQWIREFEREPSRGPSARVPRAASKGNGRRVEGRYTRVRAGFGFVEVLGREADHYRRDILIPAGMEGAALHGDRVEVEIIRRDSRMHRVVGRVASVTGPVHEQIIGTLEATRIGWRLIPESDLLPAVEIIAGVTPHRGDAGLVGLVRITRPATGVHGLAGELDRILGRADDPEVQFLTIAYEHGLRVEFRPETIAEATRLPDDPREQDFAGRDDLRDLPFVTIDGETARDFDDAVCLELVTGTERPRSKTPSPAAGKDARRHERPPAVVGRYRLWVAIADVSHYVRPGSALDAEAAERGTSVYFPDRAIPMLPVQLSNQLCSLNPDRDRLVQVVEMTYDAGGHRMDARCFRGVIRSRARLTYTQVAAALSQTSTAEIDTLRARLGPLIPQLRLMHELMKKLYRHRVHAGSLDLDLPEALVVLSEEGRSVGVRLFQRNDAHRLIEEFMLEANRAVAALLREHALPFPYRIHEPPDPEDIEDFNRFLGPFGFHVHCDGGIQPQDLQRLLDQVLGHPLARVISYQLLRSLTRAQYSTKNAGHFALAFPTYCHFTSPIRRYPDLLVHRQLGRLLDGETEVARAEGERIEAESVRSSQAEREAMEAERAMVDLKKAEFMLDHLLEPEPGTIVSVVSWGFYVELDAYPIEGLVRASDIEGDRYYYIEEEMALKGTRTGQRFRLGDRVVVKAVTVSLRRREIDFALVERLAAARRDGTSRLVPKPGTGRRKRERGTEPAPRTGRQAPRRRNTRQRMT